MVDVAQHGQTDKVRNELTFLETFVETEVTDSQAKGNSVEIGNIVMIENKENEMQANTLDEIKVSDQSIKNSSALEELENLPEVNLSDVYSNEKFGHDLLQFIEHGHSLENWHQGYHDTVTDSFSSHMQIESVPTGPIQECIDADIQSTSGSTLTLTVLNSTNSDESTLPISFSFAQPSKYDNNFVDHDYCTMQPKLEYSAADNYHRQRDDSGLVQPQQYDMGMDQEKLLRMKRRREKNRECSRQFRLKQKTKEENLKRGKIEKLQNLESLKRNVENLKIALSKVAVQCSSACPKTRMLLSHALADKENINPDFVKIMK